MRQKLAVPTRNNPKSLSDFLIENHGSIILLRPLTDAARNWVEEFIGAENGFQPYFPTVVIEPRYLADVLDGVHESGLMIWTTWRC